MLNERMKGYTYKFILSCRSRDKLVQYSDKEEARILCQEELPKSELTEITGGSQGREGVQAEGVVNIVEGTLRFLMGS